MVGFADGRKRVFVWADGWWFSHESTCIKNTRLIRLIKIGEIWLMLVTISTVLFPGTWDLNKKIMH